MAEDIRAEAEASDIALVKQAACEHKDCTGGNDYLLCNNCDLMWDYRREKASAALARAIVAETQRTEPKEPTT